MCAQGDAGGGWRTSSPENPGIKRASRGGAWRASCPIIQAQLCLHGDTPGMEEAGHIGRAGIRCLPCPWAQSSCRKGATMATAGFSCAAKGPLRRGRFQNLQARLGPLRSLSEGNKVKSWKEEETSTFAFFPLVAPSCWLWAVSGRLECHPWAPGAS